MALTQPPLTQKASGGLSFPTHPPYYQQMQRTVMLDKKLGETPLQAMEEWRAAHPQYTKIPMTYAGRLDPMAEGKLLVLLGDECKKKEKYLGLDKEYKIEVLLDLSTDTGDMLGMPTYVNEDTYPNVKELQNALKHETGIKHVPYPAFSSKTVNGKPLFLYALEGTLDSISLPTHDENIYRIKHLATNRLEKQELHSRITSMLALAPRSDEPSKVLGADFRQDAIRTEWNRLFASMSDREFTILSLRVTCASGTYMRTLAERIGKSLDTRAFALSIHRIRIGRYLPAGVWLTTY